MRFMRTSLFALALLAGGLAIACGGGKSGGGAPPSPTLSDLVISSFDAGSISLAAPVLNGAATSPAISAYIGVDGVIAVNGSTVTGALGAPVDVTAGGCTFSGLAVNTVYRIIVVALYDGGYAVRQVKQSTGGIAPALKPLAISAVDYSSITLARPAFSTAGNPEPTVTAYVGLSGTIAVAGATVSGAISSADVSAGGTEFSGLSLAASYKIIVVAQNSAGFSVQQIAQSTSGAAPVLKNLSTSNVNSTSITLDQPTFSRAGNPEPTVQAYIGASGAIAVNGNVVTGALQGPIDVSASGTQFAGLQAETLYTIVVVAENAAGYHVATINQSTNNSSPVLNSLVLTDTDPFSITIAQPTLSTTGNPQPAVRAYAGVKGTIAQSGGVVSGAVQGPLDVSMSGCRFLSLNSDTTYTIIVVAQNAHGYSVQEIEQSTSGLSPVMNALVIANADTSSVTIAQPTFYVAGNPLPSVQAFIGVSGSIALNGSSVTGALQGPVDVSAGGYQFSGLSDTTSYDIIVVAKSSAGASVRQINKTVLSTIARRVYGQAGRFDMFYPGVSLQGFCGPLGVAHDADGVYICDTANNRVLYYQGTSTTPSRVYGQSGTLINYPNTGGVSANSLAMPLSVAVDAGGVYVCDAMNNRVLYYPGASTTATRVYVQNGSFSSNTVNNGGVSANSLCSPSSVGVDAGGVYISDFGNNRVLYYPGTSTTATRVYGQNSSFTSNAANNGGVTASSLHSPTTMDVSSDGVYIADKNNNRVLFYTGASTTAARVYGQSGSFNSNAINNGGVSANSLNSPNGVAVSANGVYIADSDNHRVLYYAGASITATRVYGQSGSFTSNVEFNGGISADSLSAPGGIDVDGGGVYIADSGTNRVVYYAGASTTATRVYGTNGSFTTNIPFSDLVRADTLNDPASCAVDAGGVYVVDRYYNRVLYYAGSSTTASRVYGQGGSFTSSTENNGGVSAGSLKRPCGVAVDAGGVYIADTENNRVLYYAGTSTTATRVYGQGGSFTSNIVNNGGISANSLYNPVGVAVDAGGVYIADGANKRVLYYAGTSTTASRVYGQNGSFTSNTANNGGISANSLAGAATVTVVAGGVYIADAANNRVLYYAGTSTTASRVYGQNGSFTTNTQNNGGVSASSLNSPSGVAADGGGVYIADRANNRVLYYAGTSTTASKVWGQAGSVTGTAENNGGISACSLYNPCGVTVFGGVLYVADSWNNRVLAYW